MRERNFSSHNLHEIWMMQLSGEYLTCRLFQTFNKGECLTVFKVNFS